MSKNRFKMVEDSNGLYSIFDTEDKEDEPLIYGADFGTEKIVDLLNEQQATIKQLQGRIKRLNAFLVEKNLATEYLKWNRGYNE